jgi:hypothetical protein
MVENPRATHLCLIIVKLQFVRNRNNFSTPDTYVPSSKTEAGQQHLAQLKSHN